MSEYEPIHPRTLEDIKRAKYDKNNPPQNGNRRPGTLGNDLVDGRQGQDIDWEQD